jgi:hypothetical protein
MAKESWAGMVVVIWGRNFISFGAAYSLTPVIEHHGYSKAYAILGAIYAGIALHGVLCIHSILDGGDISRRRKRDC